MNEQTPATRSDYEKGILRVHSIFRTIQGEGPFAGRPATFVRLWGCNLKCPLCDTDYSSKCKLYYPVDLAAEVFIKSHKDDLIVITGGEPFLQDLSVFLDRITGSRDVQIETNGTCSPGFSYLDNVTVVCSPKTPLISPTMRPHVDAWKYTVDAEGTDHCGIPTSSLGCNVEVYSNTGDKPVYLQPTDYGDEAMNSKSLQRAVELCMKHGHRLSVQLNKIAKLP